MPVDNQTVPVIWFGIETLLSNMTRDVADIKQHVHVVSREIAEVKITVTALLRTVSLGNTCHRDVTAGECGVPCAAALGNTCHVVEQHADDGSPSDDNTCQRKLRVQTSDSASEAATCAPIDNTVESDAESNVTEIMSSRAVLVAVAYAPCLFFFCSSIQWCLKN